MTLTLERLREAAAKDAAIRRIQKLKPVGGSGDKIFPPTYPGERSTDPARHAFETRRIDGKDVRCVLIDSVQSQANRLEEALLGAMRDGRIGMPYVTVAFAGQKAPNGHDISDLGEITSLDAPHRVFDAVIRDSELDGVKFTDTDHYRALLLAKPTNAVEVFKLSPTSSFSGFGTRLVREEGWAQNSHAVSCRRSSAWAQSRAKRELYALIP
jgi:CRISPR-associated protein Csb1